MFICYTDVDSIKISFGNIIREDEDILRFMYLLTSNFEESCYVALGYAHVITKTSARLAYMPMAQSTPMSLNQFLQPPTVPPTSALRDKSDYIQLGHCALDPQRPRLRVHC